VNGHPETALVSPGMTLLELVRGGLHLSGTKEGCGIGECGACTVLLDGKPVTACLVLAVEADGAAVETVEGEAADGELSRLQRAFVETGAVQCGFCTPGMIMSARGLLRRSPNPTDDEIVEAMAGNLCRCTGYAAILEAVRVAAAGQRSDAPLAGEAAASRSAGGSLTGETGSKASRFLRSAATKGGPK
jgi:aerobic-type carbon monoxide dehydrogenase small subunit (CoxS/CutS family)